MTHEELVDRLASHNTIGTAPRGELAWIATHGTFERFPAGAVVSRPTEVVDRLIIVLTGRMSISVNRGGRLQKVMEWRSGDVTGLLPYSRLTTAPGTTVVEEDAEAAVLSRDDLPGLISNCHEVTSILVHVMTDRARVFTSANLRDEKLIALGKLAAGLAHELNNPASAAVRDARSMEPLLSAAEDAARAIGEARLTDVQRSEIEELCRRCMTASDGMTLSGLALADKEEELTGWLEEHGTDAALADELARTPVTLSALDHLAGMLEQKTLAVVLRWITASHAARSLALDIGRATTRIHTLVTAVKGFTHMDRDLDPGPVDITAGLMDTVKLLDGKARAKGVEVSLSTVPELPVVHGVSAEINQVWMNLIDNAIDAAPRGGHVRVHAGADGRWAVITVTDDGPGIPDQIRGQIFDPFFTTKGVGEGTGLGLDIVRRVVEWHKGEVSVASAPGRTEFRVSIPAVSNDR